MMTGVTEVSIPNVMMGVTEVSISTVSFFCGLLISHTQLSESARLPRDFWSSAGESEIRGASLQPIFYGRERNKSGLPMRT